MAAVAVPFIPLPFIRQLLRPFAPNVPRLPIRSAPTLPVSQFLPAIALPSLLPNLSGAGAILRDIWDSVLRAVPKKKTTHSKSRMRQLAGKALKDVTFLVKCPSCGRPKRPHYLCPYCVQAIRSYWHHKDHAKTEQGGVNEEVMETK